MLTRGTYVIMNETDCPMARLVAVLKRFDQDTGIWHALYLSKFTRMSSPYGPSPTPLSDFGQRVEWDGDRFRVIPTGAEPSAQYRDGISRMWQDRFSEDRWWDARKGAVTFCARFGK